MRVSTGMIQQSTLNQLQTVWSRVQELQTRISTGKRIQRPSDDPIATGHILRTRSNIRATNQYLRNIDESAAYANAAESVVTRLVDLVQTVQTIAVKIADDSYGPVSLAGLGTELEGLLDEAMGHANTKYAGTRLFGGFQTRSEPFETTLREDGQITGVQAVGEGLDGDINRLVGENLLLTINLKGSDQVNLARELCNQLGEIAHKPLDNVNQALELLDNRHPSQRESCQQHSDQEDENNINRPPP